MMDVTPGDLFTPIEMEQLSTLASTADEKSGLGDNSVSVAVRIRPLNHNDKAAEAANVLSVDNGTVSLHNPRMARASKLNVLADAGSEHSFNFDHVFDSSPSTGAATQKEVFYGVGLPVVVNAVLGFNASVFAYGQTGSGKSHTMMGCKEQPGLVPFVTSALFAMIEKRFEPDTQPSDDGGGSSGSSGGSGGGGYLCTVEGSFLEIYQERVFDLLEHRGGTPKAGGSKKGGTAAPTALKLREDKKTGIFVEGLTSRPVATYLDVMELVEAGLHRRTVAATNMNLESSRSHSVFSLVVSQRDTKEGAAQSKKVVFKSKISLIDLAGSERVERTGATGQRLKEGQVINKSLLTLGRCISALAKAGAAAAAAKEGSGGGKKAQPPIVPFRESTLTLLLRESLMGNSRTVMVAAVSPSSRDSPETTSTLRFASTCKELKTKAKVNEVNVSDEVRQLKAEVEELREELARAKAEGVNGRGHADAKADDVKGRISFLETKLQTLDSSELMPQEIRRLWINAVAEQARKRGEQDNADLLQHFVLDGSTSTQPGGGGGGAGGGGSQTAAALPYLYNLDQDPQMQGQLPLLLPQGSEVRIGRSDSSLRNHLEINGLGIAREHCAIRSVAASSSGAAAAAAAAAEGGGQDEEARADEVRCLETFEGASVFVNGRAALANSAGKGGGGGGGGGGTLLRHGDRVVLGSCTMVFIFVVPRRVLDVSLLDQLCTYWDALQEVFSSGAETSPKRSKHLKASTSRGLGGEGKLRTLTPVSEMRESGEFNLLTDDEDDDDDDGENGDGGDEAMFRQKLARVSKDVIQVNTIGKEVGLVFEAHVAVGPLPINTTHDSDLDPLDNTSDLLGIIPIAHVQFRVKCWFELQHQQEGEEGEEEAANGGGGGEGLVEEVSSQAALTRLMEGVGVEEDSVGGGGGRGSSGTDADEDGGDGDGKGRVVVLVDCAYEDFAEVSMRLITAYGGVVHVARDLLSTITLLEHEQTSSSSSSSGGSGGGSSPESSGFFCTTGNLSQQGRKESSSSLTFSDLKDAMAAMELEVAEAELRAHFKAYGSTGGNQATGGGGSSGDEDKEPVIDFLSAKVLLLRHLKLKLGRTMTDVMDADAFALFIRDDLLHAANSNFDDANSLGLASSPSSWKKNESKGGGRSAPRLSVQEAGKLASQMTHALSAGSMHGSLGSGDSRGNGGGGVGSADELEREVAAAEAQLAVLRRRLQAKRESSAWLQGQLDEGDDDE